MSAKAILERLADIRASVNKRAGWDKKNRADDLRGSSASKILKDNKQAMSLASGTEVEPLQEVDINSKSSAVIGDLTFSSQEEGPQAQLLAVRIKDGASLKVKVKDGSRGYLVDITIDEGVTTNDEVKSALDASNAFSLMSVAVAAGQGAALASVSEVKELKGGA